MARVIIFDDNKNLTESLKAYFEDHTSIQIIACIENCLNVINEIINHQPDVILMDIDMPVISGIEAVKLIKKEFPNILIIMQTVFEDDDKIISAIEAGADGYILKSTKPDKLTDAILDVIDGGAPMTASVAKKVLQHFSGVNKKSKLHFSELTHRENELLQLLTKGLSYKAIAVELDISFNTVKNHIKNIYTKLNVNSVGEVMNKVFNV